jgi:hypothetical protein
LETDVADSRGTSPSDAAIRPDFFPCIWLLKVIAIAKIFRDDRPVWGSNRCGEDFLGKTVDRRLTTGIVAFQSACSFLNALEVR